MSTAVLVFVGLSTAAPTAVAAPPFDAQSLRTVPIVDILRKQSGHLRLTIDPDWNEEERKAGLAEIAAMTPHRRTLFWLVYFENSFEYPWAHGDRDGLFTFFFRDSGTYVREVRDALLSAGLAEEAALLAQTEGLFGPDVALQTKERQALLLGSDPSRFDGKRLVALEQNFDDRATLIRKITTFIANTPDLSLWADERRRAFSDYDRLRNLIEHLEALPDSSTFDKILLWPAPYRNIRLTVACDEVLESGEFSLLFEDFDEDWLLAMIAAVRAVGLEDQARQVEAGYSIYPKPYPSSGDERVRLDLADNGALEKRLNAIKGPLCDGQETALIAYAQREGVLPR